MKNNNINKVQGLIKGIMPLCLMALLPFFIACSHIDEDEQLIEINNVIPTPEPEEQPTSIGRNVLLEDFTGQRCPNCPKGTEVIEQLQEAYGERIIAVAIHGGPLGFKGNAKVKGLATEIGDEYFNHWNLEYQPVGLIDRGPATNYTDWLKVVKDELGYLSEIKMEAEATLKGDQIEINVKEEAYTNFSGKLQVWVLEDGIVALQTMPEGNNNSEYVHNHVLRTPVNGTWGEDFSINISEKKEQTLTQTVSADWNPANLSIVAFVYNDYGVEQVVKTKVK